MKRTLILLMALLLLANLAGCGGGDAETTPTDVSADPEASVDPEASADPAASADPEASVDPEASADPESTPAPTENVYTVSEAVNRLKSLDPAVLGLEGTDMSGYRVYASEEAVRVDGVTCAKLSVYKISDTADTNVIQGVYLLARNGTRLFQLDPETKAVTELEMK